MGAKTRGVKVHPTASPGLVAGSEGDQHGVRGPTALLARELGRYTVAGGLASLVDVGLLWGLTHGMGVYYLHAAALAFGGGLLTSYLLSIGWVFQQRTWQNSWVEVGALYAHRRSGAAVVWRLHVGIDRIRAPALSLLQAGVSPGGVWLEFRGEEVDIISPVTTPGSLVDRAVTATSIGWTRCCASPLLP